MALVASWGTPLAPPPHVRAHSLLLNPMVVVLPDDHPLATGQPADTELHLEQLRHDAWVSILAGHAAREQFHDAAREAGFTPTVRFETGSYDVAQALVGTGISVALVSRLALTHAPGTTHRELAHPRPYRQIYAVTKTDAGLTPLADMLNRHRLVRSGFEDLYVERGAGRLSVRRKKLPGRRPRRCSSVARPSAPVTAVTATRTSTSTTAAEPGKPSGTSCHWGADASGPSLAPLNQAFAIGGADAMAPVPCAYCASAGVVCPRTWRWSASTTSRPSPR